MRRVKGGHAGDLVRHVTAFRAEGKPGLGVVENVAELAQAKLRIERHRRHARGRIPDHGSRSREIRLRPDRNAIASFDTGPFE
jgi:hypothetical protein